MAKKKTASNNGAKTLGPISDLERHLPSDWWQTLFNSLYLKTDGDVVENDGNTIPEVDMIIQAAGLDKADAVLDLCCGQGRHCLELARRGFEKVTGVDRSRYLIRLARKRAARDKFNINFHEGDARKFRLPESQFRCVTLMGNSFGYFDQEEDDLEVLKAVKRVMVSGGVLVMDLVDGDWMRDNFEKRSWEWIDKNHFVCRERSMAADGFRLISREVITHAERGIIADQFYAERLYNWERISKLLTSAGFLNIRHHGRVSAMSDRDQDLGMMAHRIFITAIAPHKKKTVVRKGPAFPNVTVLMGDPSLPDAVKLDGQFNSEDFETINRLKSALAELPGYDFKYINNHNSLIAELKKSPPGFVFNLCDEGYNNDPFKELHVPALLEMFNIPYSGAGPASLGFCYNKSLINAIARSVDIPVPLETYFNPSDTSANLPSIFPALVKPNFGDSSIGITKDAVVHNPEELVEYLAKLREMLPGCPVLVEEYLSGPEYSVGVIGNSGLSYKVLPPLEVDYSNLPKGLPHILGYESKWDPNSPYWTSISYHEARLSEENRAKLYDYSNILFERCGCRDYARFDFRTDDDGEIKLLEVNPNPGWCWDGKLNFMAGYAGLSYKELLEMILQAAQERLLAEKK
ncbi:MAG: methyltransferase domain-containing protein [Phycisphaerae bacterium]|nr:methyltransferase domain-containing protein [Phycisphaerae bacterium]